jgi:hypothetical protein
MKARTSFDSAIYSTISWAVLRGLAGVIVAPRDMVATHTVETKMEFRAWMRMTWPLLTPVSERNVAT